MKVSSQGLHCAVMEVIQKSCIIDRNLAKLSLPRLNMSARVTRKDCKMRQNMPRLRAWDILNGST
jgi:hypothetical protein